MNSITDFYTTEEAARLLRVHRRTIYNWIRRDIIPAVKFGRHYRIPRRALEEFIRHKLER